jgi:CRP-like cAMP-binding protein
MATPIWRNPLGNQLLAALPAAEYQRIEPKIELVMLNLGQVVNDPLRGTLHGYFLVDGVVSLIGRTTDGKSSGVALVGNEGVVGACLVLGDDTLPFEFVALQAASAFRLSVDELRKEAARGGVFQWLLLQSMKSLMCQITQTAICNNHHSVDRRLSKCLLLMIDRVSGPDLALTHQFMAGILGLRREEVTLAIGRLQESGVLHNTRGRITVTDRSGLERFACDCYHADRATLVRMQAHIRSRVPERQ